MLTIRSSQMRKFQEEAEVQFQERLVAHVRIQHPEETAPLTGGELSQRVRDRIERARRYGLTWESTIASFVALTFAIGPRFDEHPAIRAALLDSSLSPNARIDALMRRTPPEVWQIASLPRLEPALMGEDPGTL